MYFLLNLIRKARITGFYRGYKMMDILRLVRYSETRDGTFGVLEYNNEPFCLTLEPNDRGNGRNSCIPPGRYICEKHSGTKYKNTWCVTNVPGRTAILFHAGNIEDDSLGCILLGSSLGSLKGKLGVMSSSNTFNRFMNVSARAQTLNLTIEECF